MIQCYGRIFFSATPNRNHSNLEIFLVAPPEDGDSQPPISNTVIQTEGKENSPTIIADHC
jgi:hypothetical protein